MIYTAVKKRNRLIIFLFLLLFSGCGQTSQNQSVAENAQNQLAVNNSQKQTVKKDVPEEKFERDEKLQAEADALLPLFDKMPPVPVYVTDEVIQKAGTNTEKGMAYTHCYGQERPAIFFKKAYYRKTNRKQLINAMKHELTHAWLCRQSVMWGHDERFYKKFRQVGGFGN